MTDAGFSDAGFEPADGGAICRPTTSDAFGPFHRPNAPFRTLLADENERGDRLLIDGRILGEDCLPLGGVVVDIWQADVDGAYDETSGSFRLRGRIRTDASGRFGFESIRPGHYPLAGSMRPAHVHVQVTGPRIRTLTTQLYFAGDPFLDPNDPCGTTCNSGDPARIMALAEDRRAGTTWWSGNIDLTVRAG
jgi:catechol 1,2-dioxygenase